MIAARLGFSAHRGFASKFHGVVLWFARARGSGFMVLDARANRMRARAPFHLIWLNNIMHGTISAVQAHRQHRRPRSMP